MPNIDPQAKAGLAKAFSETEYGKWFLKELERRIAVHREIAETTEATNYVINHTKQASGLKEALNVIQQDVKMADSPAFKKRK